MLLLSLLWQLQKCLHQRPPKNEKSEGWINNEVLFRYLFTLLLIWRHTKASLRASKGTAAGWHRRNAPEREISARKCANLANDVAEHAIWVTQERKCRPCGVCHCADFIFYSNHTLQLVIRLFRTFSCADFSFWSVSQAGGEGGGEGGRVQCQNTPPQTFWAVISPTSYFLFCSCYLPTSYTHQNKNNNEDRITKRVLGYFSGVGYPSFHLFIYWRRRTHPEKCCWPRHS